MLPAALAVVLADELADGTRGAALPLIRHDLGLTYWQVGLLASVPAVAGGVLELPLGLLAGAGRRRAVLTGGAVFTLALAAVAAARTLPQLMTALVVFYPASGAFVALTQAELMDAVPERRAQHMARWELAGSCGAVGGPLLLAAVLAAGGGWRQAYLLLGAAGAAAWLGMCRCGPVRPAAPDGDMPDGEIRATARAVRETARAARGVLHWLVLLQAADLLTDVFTGFVALYLVDVAHARPSGAALAVAVRLGAALAGGAALVPVLERVRDLTVLRVTAAAAAPLFPCFLLVPGLAAKLVVLAALSMATAPWYPLLQARLYAGLPGRSGAAVSLSSAAGLAGGLWPLAVGMAAQAFGLRWALAGLAAVPFAVLAGARPAGRRSRGSDSARGRIGGGR